MRKFIGTKMVEARPMNRGDYNNYKGWTIPPDEDPEDEGYLVRYSDDYESWSPKKQFEESYRLCDGLSFGISIELLRRGYILSRHGWNGDKTVKLQFNELTEKEELFFTDNSINISGWPPNQEDIFTEDWFIVEQKSE